MSAPTLFRSRDSQDDPAVALVHAISQQDAESDILSFIKEIGLLSYVVEPFLRSASLYALTAATGSGKTALLVSMAFAVATGRSDVLGQEVQLGRVAYFTAENPDDLRTRFAVGLDALGIKPADVRGRISVFDRKMSPEEMARKVATLGDVNLVIVDNPGGLFRWRRRQR
jgi:hypothetical protein